MNSMCYKYNMKMRDKFLELIKARGPKYKGRKKSIIEKKIDNMLTNKVLIESVSSVTDLLDGIPYVLIGGHAITIHGSPRTTDDIDIMTYPKYVDDIVEKLGLKVSSSLTIGGVAATTPSGIEIDIIAPNKPWLDDAIKSAEKTKYGNVISKPYLVLTKIWASRGVTDDADSIKMLASMGDKEQQLVVQLVDKYFSSMSDDIKQMVELANMGFNL